MIPINKEKILGIHGLKMESNKKELQVKVRIVVATRVGKTTWLVKLANQGDKLKIIPNKSKLG